MAHRYTTWAWNTKTGNPTRKLVLVALADHANADGRSWIGQESLADMADTTSRTVRDHLAHLETLGLLRRTRRHRNDGSRTSDYADLPPVGPDGQIGRWHLPEDSSGPTGRSDRTYRKILPNLPEASSPHESSGEPSGDPSVESMSAEADELHPTEALEGSTDLATRPEDDRDAAPVHATQTRRDIPEPGGPQLVLQAYNDHRGDLPAAQALNSARRRKINGLIREFGLEQATKIMQAGTMEVATDPWWQQNRYGLDNLLAGQRVVAKAETAADRFTETGTLDRDESAIDRMTRALQETG